MRDLANVDPCILRVAGDWAVYSTDAGLWRRSLASGESILVVDEASALDDVSTNGDVVYTADYDAYRWRDGSAHAVTNDGAQTLPNVDPFTDGSRWPT